jgi:hypothetical protein
MVYIYIYIYIYIDLVITNQWLHIAKGANGEPLK